jgi:hypothetical protein
LYAAVSAHRATVKTANAPLAQLSFPVPFDTEEKEKGS